MQAARREMKQKKKKNKKHGASVYFFIFCFLFDGTCFLGGDETHEVLKPLPSTTPLSARNAVLVTALITVSVGWAWEGQ